jgi:hypothetical protein
MQGCAFIDPRPRRAQPRRQAHARVLAAASSPSASGGVLGEGSTTSDGRSTLPIELVDCISPCIWISPKKSIFLLYWVSETSTSTCIPS